MLYNNICFSRTVLMGIRDEENKPVFVRVDLFLLDFLKGETPPFWNALNVIASAATVAFIRRKKKNFVSNLRLGLEQTRDLELFASFFVHRNPSPRMHCSVRRRRVTAWDETRLVSEMVMAWNLNIWEPDIVTGLKRRSIFVTRAKSHCYAIRTAVRVLIRWSENV